MAAIHLRGITVERHLHVEPLDVQFDGKAAVTERLPSPLPKKLAESIAQAIH